METPCFCIELQYLVQHSSLCRVELKRELDGLERAAAPHAVPRSPRRVLRPGVLMRVVDPAVDVSILLRDLYREADVAALIFAAARHGERASQVAAALRIAEKVDREGVLHAERVVRRRKRLTVPSAQHAAGRVAVRPPVTLPVRPQLNCLGAAVVHRLRPEEVMEDDPSFRAVGLLRTDRHAGQAQLLRIVHRVDLIAVFAGLRRHFPAVVHRLVLRATQNLRRALARGDVLRTEIVQHRLGKAELEQLRLCALHLGLRRIIERRPLHRIAAAERIAAGHACREEHGERQHELPVLYPDRNGRDRAACVIQLACEREQPAHDDDVQDNHDDARKPAAPADQTERAQHDIPYDQRGGRAAFPFKACLLPQRLQAAPQADHLCQHHRQIDRRQHHCGCCPCQHIRIDRRIQYHPHGNVERAEDGDDIAALEACVFPAQCAKADQQKHHADRRENVVQTQHIQCQSHEGHADQHARERLTAPCTALWNISATSRSMIPNR